MRLSLHHALRGLAIFLLAASPASAITVLVEAEQLELPGGWQLVNMVRDETVRKFMLAGPHSKGAPLVGAVEIPKAGKWRLWVRSKDYPADRPGVRNFTVRLGDQRSTTVFGRHGKAENGGWAWEDGGTFDLPAGPTLLAIGDESTQSARCDAIVLTDNQSYVPEGVPWKLQKPAAQYTTLTVAESSKRGFLPAPLTEVEKQPVATLQNGLVQFAFHTAKTDAGPAIALRASTRKGERWIALGGENEEGYRVLFRPAGSDPKILSRRVNPEWDTALSPVIEAQCGAASVKTKLGIATAPWASGKTFPLRPSAARQIDPHTVELSFPACEAGQLSATWHLADQAPSAAIELKFTPAKPGHVSLGYHGPLATAPANADFLLLPFMYHARRFPEQPAMLLNALTPTPLALVNRDDVSCAVVADPQGIPFEWPTDTNSRYALGLRNELGAAQPLLYAPVLGLPGSATDGAPVQAKLHLWLQRGDWYAAYRRIADDVFGLSDYRRPTTASLSDTALNLLDYIRNEEASGWSAKAKGPWNIESRNTVSQVSPLTYLSLYLLTGDEDIYRRFARPSLEYLLSRPGPHFAAEHEIWDNYYSHQPMRGPGAFVGANTLAPAYAMTQGKAPAFGSLSLDASGIAREMHGNGHTQHFADALALYRLTGEHAWLNTAIAAADKYIAANLTTLPAKDLGPMPFANVSFTPDWEGLLQLFEASGEKRFLDAATEGARWHLTNLWTQPSIPNTDRTIHPGGVYDANRHIWWFGDILFRRGVYQSPAIDDVPYPPPPRLPERNVPAWQVSQVGLGLEQPSTYNRNGPQANILMSVWAPSLLRLAALSGDDSFRTAARNAMIGRFANYPGYYLDGFTNEYHRPDYPVTGPDVTSFYVHHVPPFTAGVLDYLFSDAEVRTKGAVKFPSVRQCGYVWFDSRVFGHAPGNVYGMSAWPWLHRTAASVDTINVDRLLAEGDGKFHVVLLNQVREAQTVHVRFDEKVLGRSVAGAIVQLRLDNGPTTPLALKDGMAEVKLTGLGVAALTLDGVKIDVPTHRVTPPSDHIALPSPAASPQRATIPGTKLEAVGTMLAVSPFTWRDLFVYVTAGIDDLRGARLRYRVGDAPEQTVEGKAFPWEFSVRLDNVQAPVTWTTEVQLPDGKWVTATPPTAR